MLKRSAFFCALLFLLSIHSAIADELEVFDFELEFASQQKSTLENFPFQAIEQDELSETAIEGALQVQTHSIERSDDSGKPIYQKQKENNQKKQTKKVLTDAEKDALEKSEQLNFSQILPVQPMIQPIYQQPTGRTYTEHQTTVGEQYSC